MLITIALVIIGAGAVGGLVNAFLVSNSGFILPGQYNADGTKVEPNDGKVKVWKPGAIGNCFVGGVGAVISWGLYSPFADYVLLPHDPQSDAQLTMSALVGAILVGAGGAKMLTAEIDKKVDKKVSNVEVDKKEEKIDALSAEVDKKEEKIDALSAKVDKKEEKLDQPLLPKRPDNTSTAPSARRLLRWVYVAIQGGVEYVIHRSRR